VAATLREFKSPTQRLFPLEGPSRSPERSTVPDKSLYAESRSSASR
jgi:hypothetical protein